MSRATSMPAAADTRLAAATFAFGELRMKFESGDGDWMGYLDRRYRRFADDDEDASFVVRFEPRGLPPAHLPSPLAVHLESVRSEPTPSGFLVETDTSQGVVDLRARRALLRGPSAMYPLDNLLRHLLPILWERGLLVHAAAIEDGFLAIGPSGAGKSTLSRLSRGRALSDELSGVSFGDGTPSVVALPFWESRPGRAHLRAVLCLGRGERHRLEPLRPEEALRRMATQVLWPVWDEASMERSFGYLSVLVGRVPAFDLFFTPTEDVWDFIDKELP